MTTVSADIKTRIDTSKFAFGQVDSSHKELEEADRKIQKLVQRAKSMGVDLTGIDPKYLGTDDEETKGAPVFKMISWGVKRLIRSGEQNGAGKERLEVRIPKLIMRREQLAAQAIHDEDIKKAEPFLLRAAAAEKARRLGQADNEVKEAAGALGSFDQAQEELKTRMNRVSNALREAKGSLVKAEEELRQAKAAAPDMTMREALDLAESTNPTFTKADAAFKKTKAKLEEVGDSYAEASDKTQAAKEAYDRAGKHLAGVTSGLKEAQKRVDEEWGNQKKFAGVLVKSKGLKDAEKKLDEAKEALQEPTRAFNQAKEAYEKAQLEESELKVQFEAAVEVNTLAANEYTQAKESKDQANHCVTALNTQSQAQKRVADLKTKVEKLEARLEALAKKHLALHENRPTHELRAVDAPRQKAEAEATLSADKEKAIEASIKLVEGIRLKDEEEWEGKTKGVDQGLKDVKTMWGAALGGLVDVLPKEHLLRIAYEAIKSSEDIDQFVDHYSTLFSTDKKGLSRAEYKLLTELLDSTVHVMGSAKLREAEKENKAEAIKAKFRADVDAILEKVTTRSTTHRKGEVVATQYKKGMSQEVAQQLIDVLKSEAGGGIYLNMDDYNEMDAYVKRKQEMVQSQRIDDHKQKAYKAALDVISNLEGLDTNVDSAINKRLETYERANQLDQATFLQIKESVLDRLALDRAEPSVQFDMYKLLVETEVKAAARIALRDGSTQLDGIASEIVDSLTATRGLKPLAKQLLIERANKVIQEQLHEHLIEQEVKKLFLQGSIPVEDIAEEAVVKVKDRMGLDDDAYLQKLLGHADYISKQHLEDSL